MGIDTNKIRACAPLLPTPSDEVVAELCDELDGLRAAPHRRWKLDLSTCAVRVIVRGKADVK